MRIKVGVVTEGVEAPTWYAVGVVEGCYVDHGYELTVTSMKDGHENRPHSLHNLGLAFDGRTRNIPQSTLEIIYKQAVARLNPLGYDVILETNPPHLHCEYQPKDGEHWLEQAT
jgi:hypothetical protein